MVLLTLTNLLNFFKTWKKSSLQVRYTGRLNVRRHFDLLCRCVPRGPGAWCATSVTVEHQYNTWGYCDMETCGDL